MSLSVAAAQWQAYRAGAATRAGGRGAAAARRQPGSGSLARRRAGCPAVPTQSRTLTVTAAAPGRGTVTGRTVTD